MNLYLQLALAKIRIKIARHGLQMENAARILITCWKTAQSLVRNVERLTMYPVISYLVKGLVKSKFIRSTLYSVFI